MATFDTILNRLLWLIVPAAVLAAGAFAVIIVMDRLSLDRWAAERRALGERAGQLTASTLAPGSALPCLDADAGDTVESACEAAIFASPQSAAAAVAYVGARLGIVADALKLARDADDPAAIGLFTAQRRALELDRYGIAAHLLATRDGCTPLRCAAFALFADAGPLKANMKAQTFDQYVSRHVAAWSGPPPAALPPVAAVPETPAAPAAVASADSKPGEPVAHPLSDKYDFPSAASIPPVSIMNTEPALPKATATAQAAEFKNDAKAAGALSPADKTTDIPVPPRRPQVPGDPSAPPAQVR